jgi:hypothetical protein
MTMQNEFDRPIDLIAVEREARRLRAEAFSQAVRSLRDRLLRRESRAAAHAA